MKLTSITISNVLGVKEAAILAKAPFLFLAGPNGAGKSSIAEAVRQALTGEPVRVSLKKEYAFLVNDRAKVGSASVTWEGGEVSIVLPSGDRKGHGAIPEAMPMLLDPARFAAMDGKERRSFLLGLMGVKITPATVKEKMIARGCSAELLPAILPYLSAGFDAAQKEVQGKARDAKAAWRTVTNETYGANKAEGWKADVPTFDAEAIAEAENAVAEADEKIEAANQAIGAMQSKAAGSADAARRRAELSEKAGRKERIESKLKIDREALAEWEEKVAQTKVAASAPTSYECPDCGVALVLKDGKLEHAADVERGDPEAAEKLPGYEKALTLCKSMVGNGERDLREAIAAAEALAVMGEAEPVIDDEAIQAEKSKVEGMKKLWAGAASTLDALRDAQRKAKEASDKTAKAAKYHGEVKAWDAIADALAPDGIPGDFLAAALSPFNEALSHSAEAAQWPAPVIDGDMNIFVGDLAYDLRSESEKWRADALIASVIARISGAKFFLLDRFDVLDAQGRSDAFYWLDALAVAGHIESAIVLGTLKAMPKGLPETIQGEWVEGGRVVSREEVPA